MYYACYYPEGEDFRERVAAIVNYFRENGYNVIMDVMVSGEVTSQGPTRWAESQMRKARKVLVFLSQGLVNLAFDGRESLQTQVIILMIMRVTVTVTVTVTVIKIKVKIIIIFIRPSLQIHWCTW